MKNEKKVMLLSLTILAVLLTGFTWAYWNSGKIEASDVKSESNTIQIGSGDTETIVTKLSTVNRNGDVQTKLVPQTVSEKDSKVELVYDLGWQTSSKAINGSVASVNVSNLTLSLKDNRSVKTEYVKDALNDMFKVEYKVQDVNGTQDTIAINSSTQIFVTVEFISEPYSKDIYDLIQSNELLLSFDVSLDVE